MHRDVVELGQLDLSLSKFAEVVFQQGEIRQTGFISYRHGRQHVQRVEVAGVEIAVGMCCRQDQRGQALAESQFTVRKFIDGGR